MIYSTQSGPAWLKNPAEGRNYQMEALKDAKAQSVVENADWVWIADVDEFPNIHVGDHSFAALIEACGDPQAISLNFQFFANNDIERFEDRPVIVPAAPSQFSARYEHPEDETNYWLLLSSIPVATLLADVNCVHYRGRK